MGHTRGFRAARSRAAVACMAALVSVAGLVALAGCGRQAAATAASRPASASAPGGGIGNHLLARSTETSPGGSQSGISGGTLFGGTASLVTQEPKLGRQLAIIRLYLFLGQAFPGKYAPLLAGGRTALVSLDSGGPSYASIAAGHQDAAITAFLNSVNQAAIQYNLGSIYFSFEHEPDNSHHRFLGSPQQFIQAWDHVHQLAQSAHLDWNDGGRIHWVFILVHNTYSDGRASSFWPGNGEADIVASDGYNSSGCRSASSSPATPASLFDPVMSFGAAHGDLPVFAAEWGSDTSPAGIQATFINEMHTYVAAHPKMVAALYWDLGKTGCTYRVDGHPASISALATMGKSAALQGHV